MGFRTLGILIADQEGVYFFIVEQARLLLDIPAILPSELQGF
jgi:hypothetical protein